MENFVNCFSHRELKMNDGRIFEPSGTIPTVAADLRRDWYGKVQNMPEPQEGTVYIVPGVVFAALQKEGKRKDFVTVSLENCGRNANGWIESYEDFLRL